MDKEKLLILRLRGMTYQGIADQVGVSRQRVQQLLSPPLAIRKIVVDRAKGKCQNCGILVGSSGHIHHSGQEFDTYNDIEKLKLLCASCHLGAHSKQLRRLSPKLIAERNNKILYYWNKGYRQVSIARMFKMKVSTVSMVIWRAKQREKEKQW